MKQEKWTVDTWDVHDAVRIPKGSRAVMDGDYCVAIILSDNDKPVDYRVKLIAAAPDLLAACLMYRDMITPAQECCDAMDAAIKKALGE